MCTIKSLIVGICGVTCGGKTTVARKLNKLIPNSTLVVQDDYFLNIDDPRHTYIPELNHINYDIITSLDMDKMYKDIQELIKTNEPKHITTNNLHSDESGTKVYIIEGFSIFNYKPIVDMCHLKYYFTLPYDVCQQRRNTRTYDPPDCPLYFEKCVWPEYLNLLEDVKQNVEDVVYFVGTLEPPIQDILRDIQRFISDSNNELFGSELKTVLNNGQNF